MKLEFDHHVFVCELLMCHQRSHIVTISVCIYFFPQFQDLDDINDNQICVIGETDPLENVCCSLHVHIKSIIVYYLSMVLLL